MQRIKNWFEFHQASAFFLIAFGITFGLGFSLDAVMNQGMETLSPMMSIAICGPALAGIIVSRICNKTPKSGSGKQVWVVFFAALTLATLVFLAYNTNIHQAQLSPEMVLFVAVFSVPVAYVISQAFSRVPSIRQYLVSMVRVRGVWGWLLLALIVPTGLYLLSIVVSNLLGRQSMDFTDVSYSGVMLIKMIVVTFFYQVFFFNLTGEEAGWRGFALPRLQARTSPLIASLVLTFFWATWHFFYWKAGGEPVLTWDYWQDTFVRLFPATLMLNWFYNRSKGSILVAGFTHAAANIVFAFMPRVDWSVHTSILYIFALILILIDQMWRKLPDDHPAAVQSPHKELGLACEVVAERI